jgi:hypothetical protein
MVALKIEKLYLVDSIQGKTLESRTKYKTTHGLSNELTRVIINNGAKYYGLRHVRTQGINFIG